jgi:hypothetical protein
MWGVVLALSLTSAQDPVRIGIVVLLISRSRPMRYLLAYWVGLMAAGFGASLAALFLLRDFMTSVVRVMTSAVTNPVVPPFQIALGVLALSTAAILAAPASVRQAAHVLVPGGDPSGVVFQPKIPTVFSRLSWRGLLDGESLRVAFVAGLCTSIQFLEFCAAMIVILASGAGVGTRVGAALMFNLMAFAIAEIPLISYLVSPVKTQAVVTRLYDWLRAHRRPIFVFIFGVVGVLMVVDAVGRF